MIERACSFWRCSMFDVRFLSMSLLSFVLLREFNACYAINECNKVNKVNKMNRRLHKVRITKTTRAVSFPFSALIGVNKHEKSSAKTNERVAVVLVRTERSWAGFSSFSSDVLRIHLRLVKLPVSRTENVQEIRIVFRETKVIKFKVL